MKKITHWLRSALALVTVAAVAIIGVLIVPTAAVAAAPASPKSVTDAVFRWGMSNEAGNGAFNGGFNLLSAGLVGKTSASDIVTESEWAASNGNVSIVKKNTAGETNAATWASLRTAADGTSSINPPTNANYSGVEALISNGVGTIDDVAGTASIAWTGSYTVAFYTGLTQFYVKNPVLTVADGVGTVKATLGGWGASMEDLEQFEVLPEVENVTIANLSDVVIDEDGFTATPDYLGVTITTPEDGTPQAIGATTSGSFPQSFVDFQAGTGTASYWYSSGGATDKAKLATPLSVSYTVPVEPEEPVIEAPSVTTQPKNVTVGVGESASFSVVAAGSETLSYQWQRSSNGVDWADISGATAAEYSFSPDLSDDDTSFRVVVSNESPETATSDAATLAVTNLVTVEGAQLEWAYNQYAQYGVFGPWSQKAFGENVSITQRDGAVVSGDPIDAGRSFNLVRFDNGEGSLDAVTGAGTIEWNNTGTWVLNAYNGLYGAPDETLSDPILTVDEDGSGTLSFSAEIPAHLDMNGTPTAATPPTRVNLATFTDVSFVDGVLKATPEFAGRPYSAGGTQLSVDCSGAGGSWPTEWIDFLPSSVKSHYYTTSCTGLNVKKPSLYFTVNTVDEAAAIVTQPTSVTIDGGESARFSVLATGNPISYVWERSNDKGITWTTVEGENNSALEFVTKPADNGAQFRVVVGGTVTSATVDLALNLSAPVPNVPRSLFISVGEPYGELSARANGLPAALKQQYQYSEDGVTWTNVGDVVANGTAHSIGTATAEMDGLYWRATFDNGVGTAASVPARIWTLPAAPVFTIQPTGVTALAGGQLDFSTQVRSTVNPSTVSWQYSTDNGATYTDWVFVDGESYDGGGDMSIYAGTEVMDGYLFRAVATNAEGSTNSTPVLVTIIPISGERELTVVNDGPLDPTVANTLQVIGQGFIDDNPTDTTGRLQIVVTDVASWQPGQPGTLVGSVVSTTQARGNLSAYVPKGSFTSELYIPANTLDTSKTWGVGAFATTAETRIWDAFTGLTLQSAPVFTTQPTAAVRLLTGGSTTLEVAASAAPAATYQWERKTGDGDWTAISGATQPTLQLTALTASAQYRAVATNVVGSVTSSVSVLTVLPQPTVTVSKTEGFDANGEIVTVTGSGFLPNAPLTNSTRAPLGAGNFGGAYVVFGKFATVWKASASAPSSARPVISQLWAVSEADAARLGGVNAGYLGIKADGTFEAKLTVKTGQTDKTGNYGIYTYPAGGSTYAAFETYTPITLSEQAPAIATQPGNVSAPSVPSVGDAVATFTIAATGSPAPAITWEKKTVGGEWATIADATSATLELKYDADDNGVQVRATVKSALGTAVSQAATLTVGVRAGISAQPAATSVVAGSDATFTVAVSGDDTRIQWQVKPFGEDLFLDIDGATSSKLVVAADDARNGSVYRVLASNSVPSVPGGSASWLLSNGAELSVTAPAADATDVPDSALTDSAKGDVMVVSSTGSVVNLFVGEDYAGQFVGVYVHSTPQWLGWKLVDAAGRISVTLPADLTSGDHRLVVLDANSSLVGWAGITVAAVVPDAGDGEDDTDNGGGIVVVENPTDDGELAATGLEIGALTGGALLLLLAGAFGIVVARRKKELV